ncbi:MAG: insulinase family protein [Proteobacteria bacterium]|nr:insulinase family protein [Pseudomonadota bacterium]
MKKIDIKSGEITKGFLCKQVVELADLRAVLYRFVHEGTGAELIHFLNDDENNLFSVAFRTTPSDSTGVAHILEHTALCGSERYPVRDPFFSMLKRSLNTFMNAFTANDWTMYPFSTQNEKDFYNLMDVYLDAAFLPNLKESSFKQEGWRLEFENSPDGEEALTYKGIVYNEMKGAMSDPNSLMVRRIQKALYPTTTYHYNSGGEPEDIPDLTWQGLKDFHAKYYHPSNARFFTYGNLNVIKHLEMIDDRVLSKFERVEVNTAVGSEKRFVETRREEYSYAVDASTPKEELTNRSIISVAWLTCDVTDYFETFALSILSSLLLGNAAAPLYKALMDSKIGSALAPGTGFEDENKEASFSAGLQGVNPDDADKIETLVLETLKKVVKEGFTKERIEAVIHQVEFGNKEVVGNHYPYALNVLFRIFGTWVHDADPVQPLLINETLSRLRKEVERGNFFENLIKKYFLNNPHRVTVILKPDEEEGKRAEQKLEVRLSAIEDKLTEEEKRKIINDAAELQKAQELEEDISCLPTLELKDIPLTFPLVDHVADEREGVPVYWFDQPTNGISYFNALVSAETLPPDLKPYVPLFCTLLTKVGAGGLNYMEMAERIEAHTGGIGAYANVWEDLADLDNFSSVVEISGKALVRNHGKLFEILKDMFISPDFRDLDRLHTVIGQVKTSIENSVPGSGHSYARGLAARHLTPAARLRESWAGIHHLSLIKEVASRDVEALGEVAEKLEAISAHLLNKSSMKVSVISEKRYFDAVSKEMVSFLREINSEDFLVQEGVSQEEGNEREGWSTNVPVSYVAKLFRTVPYSHDDSSTLLVLSRLLRACYLHREIREKGGAYGGFAAHSSSEGLFSFLSYRDPHLERTIQVYNDSIDWVLSGKFSNEDLKEAILSTFADIDKPMAPSGKGNSEFVAILRGLTREMRQKRREEILALDKDAIISVANKYLKGNNKSSIAVISNEEKLNEANEALKESPLKVHRI